MTESLGVLEPTAPYIAEFFGTFFIGLASGFMTISGSSDWTPTAEAFAVVAAMYSTSAVSGGHLNPAISLAFALCRQMKWTEALLYMSVQVLGGLAAGIATLVALQQDIDIHPQAGYDMLDVSIVEVIYGSTLCFVALNVMASSRTNPRSNRNQFFALAVGFVTVSSGITRNVSGSFLNPAVTVGFGLLSQSTSNLYCLLFALCQVVGAFVAAVLFFLVRPEELLTVGSGTQKPRGSIWGALSLPISESPHSHQDDHPEPEDEEASAVIREEMLQDFVSPWPARLLAEFVGTYIVVFTFGFGVVMNLRSNETSTLAPDETSGTTTPAPKQHSTAAVAWATGAAMLAMVYALAGVSGAHFNPAVTLSVVLSGRGRCGVIEGLFMMVAQCGAAILAAISYLVVRRGDSLINPQRVIALGPGDGYSWKALALGESTMTFALAAVIVFMTTVKTPRYSKAPNFNSVQLGFAAGLCMTAGGIALATISASSGGCLNPAAVVAITTANVLSTGGSLRTHLPLLFFYLGWQMLGGAAAALAFMLAHPLEYKKDPLVLS